jgi:hypothetical protein
VVIALPLILRRLDRVFLPWPVTLAAGTVLLLHSGGIALYLYDHLWWWDILTHTASAVILAMLIAVILMSFNLWFPQVNIPPRTLPFTTLACLLCLGVIWEIAEFAFDGGLDMHMQYSLNDTAVDLTMDLLGGGMVSLAMFGQLDQLRAASERMFGPPRHRRPT